MNSLILKISFGFATIGVAGLLRTGYIWGQHDAMLSASKDITAKTCDQWYGEKVIDTPVSCLIYLLKKNR